jgi:prepilin-type N-terminal cleavage/methylation domain-containing protein
MENQMSIKKNFFKNPKGFTITEILIALALVSIIALMISQLMIQQSLNTHQTTDSFEINEFVIRIGESIRNKEACVKVKSMELTPYKGDITNATFSADTDSGGTANLYRLQLNIHFEKLGNPPTTMFRSIPLIVKKNNTNNSLIYSCYTEENSWYQEMCSSLMNGHYQEQNSSLARICTDLNIKGSISTDGNFCFNKPGDIHQKDCASSWYAGWASNYGGAACSTVAGTCGKDQVVVGVAVLSCGKDCVHNVNMCCPIRLQKN